MTIKESSDELNPTVTAAGNRESRPARGGTDYLALAIATCGVGYFPIAPGTLGSIVGVGMYLLVRAIVLISVWPTGRTPRVELANIGYVIAAFELLAIIVVALVGIWAGSRTERLSGKKDPGKVVIDEVAGQMLALVAVPLQFSYWWTIPLAFVLFRLFDIIKPYPARSLESLKSGLGIMADDIVAGAYAAAAVSIVVAISYLV